MHSSVLRVMHRIARRPKNMIVSLDKLESDTRRLLPLHQAQTSEWAFEVRTAYLFGGGSMYAASCLRAIILHSIETMRRLGLDTSLWPRSDADHFVAATTAMLQSLDVASSAFWSMTQDLELRGVTILNDVDKRDFTSADADAARSWAFVSSEQAMVIVNWLKSIQALGIMSRFGKDISSCLTYWRVRANDKADGTS